MKRKIWVLASLTLFVNGLLGMSISNGINPLRILYVSSEIPFYIFPVLAEGLGSYAIFAGIVAVFTIFRRSYARDYAGWRKFFVISTFAHLTIMAAAWSGNSANEAHIQHSENPVAVIGNRSPDAGESFPAGGAGISESDLRTLADAQNASLPAKVSENLELSGIVAGPGLLLTYRMKFLKVGVKYSDFSQAEIYSMANDTISEGCVEFRDGLALGVRYSIEYVSSEGVLIFNFPISPSDCK